MKRIHAHKPIDRLSNQQRADPIQWGRRVYLCLLAVVGLALVHYAIGDAVILQAEGLVVADRKSVSATYPGKVARILVREGQHVAAGDLLLEIESADMLKDIAHLATQNADLAQREADMGLRAGLARSLLPLAEKHAREVSQASDDVESVRGMGLVTSKRAGEAIGAKFETASRVAELTSQAHALEGQLPLIKDAHRRASEALLQLENFYDHGRMRAPRAGLVGSRVPVDGQVVKFGDELLQVHGSDTTVLAYLPDSYLFAIERGQALKVYSGLTSVLGTVDAILGVAEALPPEFQNMFKPRDRSRLVRIKIPSDHPFAVSQKVTASGCYFGFCVADSLNQSRVIVSIRSAGARVAQIIASGFTFRFA